VWAQIPSLFKNDDKPEFIDYSLDWAINILLSASVEEQFKKYYKEFMVIRL
jgi:hypothetical protein